MADLSKLKLEDLEKQLDKLVEELEELEEEKSFVLKQTGLHVSGGKVKQYLAQTENLNQSIKEVKDEIARRAL